MKKALPILGRPRKKGTPQKMLNIAMQSAQQAGYEITFYNLCETNIGWCSRCMTCKASGICIIQDDAQLLRDAIIGCDLLMIASPTYFANVSAPVKNLFDRLVGAVMDDNSSMIPKPTGSVVFAGTRGKSEVPQRVNNKIVRERIMQIPSDHYPFIRSIDGVKPKQANGKAIVIHNAAKSKGAGMWYCFLLVFAKYIFCWKVSKLIHFFFKLKPVREVDLID